MECFVRTFPHDRIRSFCKWKFMCCLSGGIISSILHLERETIFVKDVLWPVKSKPSDNLFGMHVYAPVLSNLSIRVARYLLYSEHVC